MILLDTSVLVDYFRGTHSPATAYLDRLEVEGAPFAIPGVCCQELLQGAKDEAEWLRLVEYLESQRIVHPRSPWETHRDAARIYFDLRRQGITIRSTLDCWIAQLALDAEAPLLHDDEDFERIRRARPLETLPQDRSSSGVDGEEVVEDEEAI